MCWARQWNVTAGKRRGAPLVPSAASNTLSRPTWSPLCHPTDDAAAATGAVAAAAEKLINTISLSSRHGTAANRKREQGCVTWVTCWLSSLYKTPPWPLPPRRCHPLNSLDCVTCPSGSWKRNLAGRDIDDWRQRERSISPRNANRESLWNHQQPPSVSILPPPPPLPVRRLVTSTVGQ